MKAASAIVHISPALGAAFTEYTANLESGGELGETLAQRFLYVVDGSLQLQAGGKDHLLGPRGYAYLQQGAAHRITSREISRAIVIEKPYIPNSSANASGVIVGSEDSITSAPLDDDPALQVKNLLPDTFSCDFAVNTMTYQHGAALSMVEMHVMKHGLVMLEGGGIYRLGDAWYPVTAGGFFLLGPLGPALVRGVREVAGGKHLN